MSDVNTMDIVRRALHDDPRVDWSRKYLAKLRNREMAKKLRNTPDKVCLKAELDRQGRALDSQLAVVNRIFDLLVEIELALVELGQEKG